MVRSLVILSLDRILVELFRREEIAGVVIAGQFFARGNVTGGKFEQVVFGVDKIWRIGVIHIFGIVGAQDHDLPAVLNIHVGETKDEILHGGRKILQLVERDADVDARVKDLYNLPLLNWLIGKDASAMDRAGM